MEQTPFFSVIIPTYNRAHIIDFSVKSVLNQTFKNFELIVIDDGSNDNTEEVIKNIKDKRLIYIKEKASGGPANPRNVGIKKAKADWICFLDSDDRWYQNKLEKVKKIIDEENSDFIYHSMNVIGDQDREILSKIPLIKMTPPAYKSYMLNFSTASIPTSSVTVRKSLLIKAGCFDISPDLVSIEDCDLWLKITLMTEKFYTLEEQLGEYRDSEDSLTTYEIKRCQNHNTLIMKHLDESRFNKKELKHIKTYLDYYLARSFHKNHHYEEAKRYYLKTVRAMTLNHIFIRGVTFLFMLIVKRMVTNSK